MSSEHLPLNQVETPNKVNINISTKVDINHLMSKLRTEEKKKKKENLVFLGLVSSIVVITGVIASL